MNPQNDPMDNRFWDLFESKIDSQGYIFKFVTLSQFKNPFMLYIVNMKYHHKIAIKKFNDELYN